MPELNMYMIMCEYMHARLATMEYRSMLDVSSNFPVSFKGGIELFETSAGVCSTGSQKTKTLSAHTKACTL